MLFLQGAKLAKLVAWLERKRNQDAKVNIDTGSENPPSTAPSAQFSSTVLPVVRSPNGRGRPPRGSRGRGRPPRTATVIHLSSPIYTNPKIDVTEQPDRLVSPPSDSAEISKIKVQSDQEAVRSNELETEIFALVKDVVTNVRKGGEECSSPLSTSVVSTGAENHEQTGNDYPSGDNSSHFQPENLDKPIGDLTAASKILTTVVDVHEEKNQMIVSDSNLTEDNLPLKVPDPETAAVSNNVVKSVISITNSYNKSLAKLAPRRKRNNLRRRTTSESAPLITPLLLSHDISRFLSDSEADEPVCSMPDLAAKIVQPLIEQGTSVVEKKNSPSISTSTAKLNAEIFEKECKQPTEDLDNPTLAILDSITTATYSDPHVGNRLECPPDDDLSISVCTNSPNRQFLSQETSPEYRVSEFTALDRVEGIPTEDRQVVAIPEGSNSESVKPPVVDTEPESQLCDVAGQEIKSSFPLPSHNHNAPMETEPSIETVRTPSSEVSSFADVSNEFVANKTSVDSATLTSPKTVGFCDELLTSDPATENRELETSSVLATERDDSQDNEVLSSTETACEANMHPEMFPSVSHVSSTGSRDLASLLSPVSESASDFADPTDTVQVTEKITKSLAEAQPNCEDLSECETTVDADSTPILDEPGTGSQFDAESVSIHPNNSSVVGCLSETMNALFFSVRSSSRTESESHDPVNPVSQDPVSVTQRTSPNHRNTAEVTSNSQADLQEQRKTSQSESRHVSAHTGRSSGGGYQSHNSDRYHHHHHRHDRDRRDRSPTSSRHSVSCGIGNSHTHSQRSPTSIDSRRKEHLHDSVHQHRSPSTSSRSSASSVSRSHPHHAHHHYRHHSRKESSRPRVRELSSLRSESSSFDFHPSSRDQGQPIRPRHP